MEADGGQCIHAAGRQHTEVGWEAALLRMQHVLTKQATQLQGEQATAAGSPAPSPRCCGSTAR